MLNQKKYTYEWHEFKRSLYNKRPEQTALKENFHFINRNPMFLCYVTETQATAQSIYSNTLSLNPDTVR